MHLTSNVPCTMRTFHVRRKIWRAFEASHSPLNNVTCVDTRFIACFASKCNLLNHQQRPIPTPRRLSHRTSLPQRLQRRLNKRRMLLLSTGEAPGCCSPAPTKIHSKQAAVPYLLLSSTSTSAYSIHDLLLKARLNLRKRRAQYRSLNFLRPEEIAGS